MKVDGLYILKSDSGTTLYSRKTGEIQEDLFSAFLTALKNFFDNFALGGLSSFSSENYMVYLASKDNVLTSLIVNSEFKSDNYFNLAFDISSRFYNKYKDIVTSSKPLIVLPDLKEFETVLDSLIEEGTTKTTEESTVIKLFKIDSDGELESFDFVDEEQLYKLPVFVAINYLAKQIYIIENTEQNVSSRSLFMANRATSSLNQRDLKNEFTTRHVADQWDFERIVEQIIKLIKRESIQLG